MKRINLTVEQEQSLRAAHKSLKDKRQAYRINVIILWDQSFTYEEISNVLMLSEETIRNYVNRYEEGGIARLLSDEHKGSEPKLDDNQLRILDEHLQEHTYLTVVPILLFVKNEFKVTYTASGITDLLHRMGFTHKKSKTVPAKANQELQEQFLECLENTRKIKGKNDPILYMDGVHPQHNTVLAYGWIKKGEDNVVKSNTGRQRININGALDSETKEVIVREDKSINAQSTIKLLETVEAAYPLAVIIYVICDNAMYYRSKLVKEFLKGSKVRLVFLPPYSPNLNLIERLWKFMKEKVLHNQYYEKYDEFRDAVGRFFGNIDEFSDELETLLTNEFNLLDAVQT